MPQASDSRKFDVIVVGSGASGGWAAKRLSEAGVRVALLDCGKPHGDADFSEHKPAWDLKYRDKADELMRRTRPVQKDCYACMEYNAHWFANDLEEPYTTATDKPFSWQGRLRVIGGRTNVWGRQSYRLSDLDFKAKSHDGFGEDWPISYADLAPYYDIVEEYVGISGQAEGVAELPDGRFQPAMAMTCAETRLSTRVKEKLGRTITIGRTANLTKPINGRSGVSLLRAVRARLRHALVFQLGVHDSRRRAQERALHAHPERDGVEGADGSVERQGRPASCTSTATRMRPRKSTRARWCCARRRSSLSGSSSTRRTSSLPTASRTPAARSGIT